MHRVLIADHQIPKRAPLKLTAGDIVTVGERDTEWPAFVFVTALHGTGWVPSRHIDMAEATATMRTAYDTRELPASRGETVELIRDDPESGWSWCRNADGCEGWIPHRSLEPSNPSARDDLR